MNNLVILGGGNMGFAIAQGISLKRVFPKSCILFIENNIQRIDFLKNNDFRVFKDFRTLAKNLKGKIRILIIAVKPLDIDKVLNNLKEIKLPAIPVISIAAGIKIKKLSAYFRKNQPLARVMPNTPAQISEGISAVMFNRFLSKKQKKLILKIFSSIGKITEIKDENKFDLITALSGSGPAYFCYLTESLIKSAKKLGLDKNLATTLILQTASGTVQMFQKTNLSPEDLRKMVTSKRGTTEAAIKVFQKRKFNGIIYSAIKAAKNRASELSKT